MGHAAVPRTGSSVLTVGLVADTHGLLREQVLAVFAHVDHVVHAGDVGDAAVLDALRTIASVTAVRGNAEKEGLRESLPEVARIELGGVPVIVAHHRQVAVAAAAELSGRRLVVFGHSHQPVVEESEGALLVNPGSAGPRRFRLPVAVAVARIGPRVLDAEILELPG